MKKIKLLSLIAIVLAIGASAFSNVKNDVVKKENATDYAYFVFTGTSVSEENDEMKWQKVTNPSNQCDQGNNLLCTILAPLANPNDVHPDFSGISDVRTALEISEREYRP